MSFRILTFPKGLKGFKGIYLSSLFLLLAEWRESYHLNFKLIKPTRKERMEKSENAVRRKIKLIKPTERKESKRKKKALSPVSSLDNSMKIY